MAGFLTHPSQGVATAQAKQRSDVFRLVVASLGLIAVSAVSLLLALASGLRPIQLELFCLALLTAVIAALPLTVEQVRAESRHIVFALLSFVFILYYVFPAFVRYLPATGPVEAGSFVRMVSQRDVINAQILVLIGLVTLIVAYSAPVGRAIGRRLPPPRHEWPATFTLLVAGGMLAVGWIISLGTFFGIIPPSLGSGVLGTLASGRVFALALLTTAWMRFRSPPAALLLLFMVPMNMAFGVFTGAKLHVLIAPALVGLTWALERRRIPTKWIIAGCIALVFIYPANEFYRHVVLAEGKVKGAQALSEPVITMERIVKFATSTTLTEYLSSGIDSAILRVDGIGGTSVIVHDTPARVPFQHGRTLGLFFYAFVPRAIWPSKPKIKVGDWITRNYTGIPDAGTNTAPMQIAEYYLNFGVAGVIGGMLLLGLMLRLAQEYAGRRPTIPAITALVVITHYLVTLFESSVASIYGNVVFAITPLFAAHAVARTLGLLQMRTNEAPGVSSAI